MDMKAWKRVLVKTIIFLLVVLTAGGSAAGWRGYERSKPDYAVNKYLTGLIDHDTKKTYALLDQSEDHLTQQEYTEALEAKKYSLASSFQAEELETRRDSEGNEFVDYRVSFLDADGNAQTEETFTARKQAEATLGIFDTWKVMTGHCMVKDFRITVPTGAQLYLDNNEADSAWIVKDDTAAAYDCYEIPSMLPGEISVVVRHPAFESLNTTLDTADGSVDYTEKMTLKASAQDACKELGVKALKQLYGAAAKNDADSLDKQFDDCKKAAKKFVADQGEIFHQEGSVFKNAAISDFAAQFGDVVYTQEKDGAIEVEMTFSYHYVVREDVTEDGEVLADGTVLQDTYTAERPGDNTAKFVMSFADGEWGISSMEIPVIPKSE